MSVDYILQYFHSCRLKPIGTITTITIVVWNLFLNFTLLPTWNYLCLCQYGFIVAMSRIAGYTVIQQKSRTSKTYRQNDCSSDLRNISVLIPLNSFAN
ncbi:uncharacterized protein V1518DRAFT_411645 [Limtongia smithiae]|uniref:uncharacterized protein n=1 Tax=Limtongia smithiae TaxID=1125753 RepID=UPI0034CEE1C3